MRSMGTSASVMMAGLASTVTVVSLSDDLLKLNNSKIQFLRVSSISISVSAIIVI